MSRKLRMTRDGFYHIVNRGVAKSNIYLCDNDFIKFIEIIQEASLEYHFEIYSYCLMNNHYHLLIKITKENLSIIMQKINSRYSIYFNNKYKRVGPLWQGRFKSWFVFDEAYLKTLVRYIEFNPIKANISFNIGEYKWSMSSDNIECSMFNYELIKATNFDIDLDAKEQEIIDKIYSAKLKIQNNTIKKAETYPLENYFDNNNREVAIARAINDGYKQRQIAKYLKLSHVAISKIYKIYNQKVKLFNKLRDKGIFWSYSKNIRFNEAGKSLTIEYILKYADFDDIAMGFQLFGKREMKKVWENRLKSDKRFIKLNLMLARVFFGMDVESDYFKEVKNARFEKLKLLAS